MRTMSTTVVRIRRRLERILTDLKRMHIDTTTSLMGTRILIGMPSGAVVVIRQTNGGVVEAMGSRVESCLSRTRCIRRKRIKR